MKSKEEYFNEIKTYKLIANKSLGQNFLINADFAEKIVNLLDISHDDSVIEIGAGLGSLSYFLVNKNAKVTLIDIDDRMLNFLNEKYAEKSNVSINHLNILKADLSSYTKIIGNLPYYITSSIIEHILLNGKNTKKIVLMTQKEVYPKLLKSYQSPLSLLLNYVCEVSKPLDVNRNNFSPVPHVDSVVFTLTPNEHISDNNVELYKLMCKLFLFRRKTILNCLTNIVNDKEKAALILNNLGVEHSKRSEQLDIGFYISLIKQLKSIDFMIKI